MSGQQSVDFYIYNTTTGFIKMVGNGAENQIDIQIGPGEAAGLGEARDDLHYVDLTDPDNPVIADKTPVPYTLTGNLISDLPGDELQCEVAGPITDRFDIPAGETELTYTADVPGSYKLILSGVKYMPTEIAIAI